MSHKSLIIPDGFKKFKVLNDLKNQTCPGCGFKNCGIYWNGRKKRDDPSFGKTACERAEIYDPEIGGRFYYYRHNLKKYLEHPARTKLNHEWKLLYSYIPMVDKGYCDGNDDDGAVTYYSERIAEICEEIIKLTNLLKTIETIS